MDQTSVLGVREVLPELDVCAPQRQRRATVLVRALLLIPQYFALVGLSIAMFVVLVIAWFGALGLGRLPTWCAEFLGGYLRYATRVQCYLLLLVDTYPPFQWSSPDYPVSVHLAPGRLNRAAVLFRLILYIPVRFMTGFLTVGWMILALFFWATVLILGRTPQPVFDASAAVVRYIMRAQAYFLMLTSAYPKWLFGDRALVSAEYPAETTPEAYPPVQSSTRPLLLCTGGRALLILIIVLGVLGYLGGRFGSAVTHNRDPGIDNPPGQIPVVASIRPAG